MKHEVENLDGNFKKLKIEIPAENVAKAFEDTYKEIQKSAELKGFRKGKVPLNVIEQNYATTAAKHVSQTLVDQYLGEALKENELQPVAYPQIDAGSAKRDQSFSFVANFENMPAVDLKDYTSFQTDVEEIKVEEEEITRALDHVRDRMAEVKEALWGTEAAVGQVLRIDHQATENGAAVQEASGEGSMIEVGKEMLGKEFDNKVVGIKADESRVFEIEYDKEAPFLAGRKITFNVTAKAVMNKVLPELNDEFAKKIGPFQSVDELKKRVEEDLKAEKEAQRLGGVKEKFIEWLVETNPVHCPETLLGNQMQYLANETAQNLAQLGLEQSQIEDRLKEWQDDMHKRSERQVKASLLLSEIALKEKIQAGEEELRNEIMKLAQKTQRQPAELLKEFQEKGLLPGLMKQLTEVKALDVLARKAVENKT